MIIVAEKRKTRIQINKLNHEKRVIESLIDLSKLNGDNFYTEKDLENIIDLIIKLEKRLIQLDNP